MYVRIAIRARVHAGQGSDEHLRRQRLLALTGWSAEVLKPEQAQGADSNRVDATTAALRCAMCDARAGLWNLVPGMAVINQSSLKYAQGLSLYHTPSCREVTMHFLSHNFISASFRASVIPSGFLTEKSMLLWDDLGLI